MPHPDGWPQSALTSLARDAHSQMVRGSEGPFLSVPIRRVTERAEVFALMPHIHWNTLCNGLDPWCGTGTISKVLLAMHSPPLQMRQNDVDQEVDADEHHDALQPGNLSRWVRKWNIDFIVTSPFHRHLDVAVPLMALFVPVLMVLVPSTWLFAATNPRRAWLEHLQSAGRSQVIANLPTRNTINSEKRAWIIITDDHNRMRHVVKDFTGISF